MATSTIGAPAMWGSRPLAPCGTDGAFQRHVRRGEQPCDACREASRLATAQRKAKREGKPVPQTAPPRSQPAKCGTRSGYQRHKDHGEQACEPCKEAARQWSRQYNQARATGRRRGRPSHSDLTARMATPWLLARIGAQPDADLLLDALGLLTVNPLVRNLPREGA